MFEYKALDLKDFSGGMTDDFVNGRPNQGQFAENFYSLSNNSLVTRAGTELDAIVPFNNQIPSGSQRINALINYNNDSRLLVHAGAQLHFRRPEAFTPNIYSTVFGGALNNNLFKDASYQTHLAHTQWNGHLLLASDEYHKPIKVYSGQTNTGAFGVTAGLPKPADTISHTQSLRGPVQVNFVEMPNPVYSYTDAWNSGQLIAPFVATIHGSILVAPPTAWDDAPYYIEFTNHKLQTGDPIRITPYVITMPYPMLANDLVYVIKIDENNFKVATTYENAMAGVAYVLTKDNTPTVGESFQFLINIKPIYYLGFVPSAPPFNFVRGDIIHLQAPVVPPLGSIPPLPYRLELNTDYYVLPTGGNTFFLTKNSAVPAGATIEKPVGLGYHQLELATAVVPLGSYNKSYLYGVVYKYEYQIGDQTFIDRSPPRLYQISDCETPNRLPVTLTAPALVNDIPNGDQYDDTSAVGLMSVEFYRSVNGGQELYYIGELPNVTPTLPTFIDNFTDETIQNNEQIYTSAGVPANDPPPRCKYVHSVNNFTYYANIKEGTEVYPSLIRQSQGLDPDSVPASFNDQLEDEITGLSSVQDIPIVGCKKHIYRIDGNFDEQGRGGMFHRRLSDHAGCISHDSFVQAEGSLFWFGEDGIYHTEGYKCTKVTDHLNDRYKRFKETLAGKTRKIKGVYNPYMRLIFWTISTKAKITGQEDCDALWALDLSRGISDEMPSFIWNGYSTFNPTAICMYRSALHRADKFGYVLRFNEDVVTDPKIVAGTDPTTWFQETILHRWTTISSNIDSSSTRKIANKLLVDFKPEATLLNTTTVSLDINAVNDNGALVRPFKPIRWRKGFIWGGEDYIWGDPDFVWYYGGVVSVDRRFPAKGLRFNYLQIDIKAGFTNIVNSDIIATATIDSVAKTITLDDLTKKWPSQAVDYIIELEHNNFTEQYLITDRTDTVLTVNDPLNNLIDGSYRWRIKGYKKGEKINLVGMSISWAPTSRSHDTFNTSESGDLA